MWDLETPCIKNSEYESKKKKKMVPIVISTISHFVFVSLFSMLYAPPTLPTNIYLFVQAKTFFSILQLGVGKISIFFHKAINDQSCKLKNS